MNKYLLEILRQINTIIIPGLGALTITDAATGEIMFMSYLKHDDGKLAAYISEKEGMDENEAKNLIAKYVREILAELDKGEEYTMYEFGVFYKNGDDIEFKNWKEVKSTKSTTENTYIPPTPVKEKAEPIVETPKEKKIEKPKKKTSPKKEVVIPASKKEELPIDKKEEISSNKKKLEQLKKESEKETKKKKGVGFWIGILLLILLLGGGTYFGLNYDTLKDKIPFLAQEKKTYTTEDSLDTDEIEEEKFEEAVEQYEEEAEIIQEEEESLAENEMVIIENEQPEEVETEKPPVNQNSSGKFNIIIGAFSSIENAEHVISKLKAEGYSAEMKTGIRLHKVSIQSFNTSSEANSALKTLKGSYPHAWVDKW